MPNRIIKESINESEGLASISVNARDLFKRLITYADDYGRFNSNLEILRARLYPLETDVVSTSDIHDWLAELCGIGKVQFYKAPYDHGAVCKIFGFMVGWEKHQRIRNSQKKCPEPGEPINDWALQRFVPIDMKIELFERDNFTCQECKMCFRLPGIETKRAIRTIAGLIHIDHVVPVQQGGRATLENLRLLCDSCNLGRAKKPSVAELRRLAASCGDSRQNAALSESNPIQSESNPKQEAQSAAPVNKVKDIRPQTEADTLTRLAAEVGRLDKANAEQTMAELCKWTISTMHKLKGDPPERVRAVVKVCLENFRDKLQNGYGIKNVWGLADKIFEAERIKYIQGPEHEANKKPISMKSVADIFDGMAKARGA